MRFIVGISGASGSILARRVIQRLTDLGHEIFVVVTGPARDVWRYELGEDFDVGCQRFESARVKCYESTQGDAPIASGSFNVDGMIVVPCSMGTASAIAHGTAANLLQRAADCTIKEGRRLVLVPRESPLSAIHLANLLELARLGVRIVPPVPGFYSRPNSVEDIIDQVVGRALAALGVDGALEDRFIYQGPNHADE